MSRYISRCPLYLCTNNLNTILTCTDIIANSFSHSFVPSICTQLNAILPAKSCRKYDSLATTNRESKMAATASRLTKKITWSRCNEYTLMKLLCAPGPWVGRTGHHLHYITTLWRWYIFALFNMKIDKNCNKTDNINIDRFTFKIFGNGRTNFLMSYCITKL